MGSIAPALRTVYSEDSEPDPPVVYKNCAIVPSCSGPARYQNSTSTGDRCEIPDPAPATCENHPAASPPQPAAPSKVPLAIPPECFARSSGCCPSILPSLILTTAPGPF